MTFKQLFKIMESNTAGVGGCFGDLTSGTWSADGSTIDYAPNDTRIPKIIGGKKRKNKKSKKIKILRRHG